MLTLKRMLTMVDPHTALLVRTIGYCPCLGQLNALKMKVI
jgi:hypothetical protein